MNYRTLLIPILSFDLTFIRETALIKNLTIALCTSWSSLNRLFKCAPELKYFNIQGLSCDDACLNAAQAILKKISLENTVDYLRSFGNTVQIDTKFEKLNIVQFCW